MSAPLVLLTILLMLLPGSAAIAGQEPVDMELVLAVDASTSVDNDEFALQMGGIARAFRHPKVLAAQIGRALV